ARRRGRKRRPSRNAAARPTAVEKSLRLGIPHPPRDSHFPTAATTNFRLHFQCLDNPSQGYILKWLDRGSRIEMFANRKTDWLETESFAGMWTVGRERCA